MLRFLHALAALALLAGPAIQVSAQTSGDRPTAIDWNLSAAAIASLCADQLARERVVVDAIAKAPASTRTFDGTILPLEDTTAAMYERLNPARFLAYVSTDPEVRKASFACGSDVSAFDHEFASRPDLYAAFLAVEAGNTAKTDAQKQLLATYLLSGRQSGAMLNDADRKTFIELSKHLTQLSIAFTSNISEDASTISVKPAQSAGLDPDFVATLKTAADGSYIVPVNESTLPRIMNVAKDASVRKAFTVAFDNRAGDKNDAILVDAIATRDRLAHLLGYKTWAAFRLSDRMAKSPDRVMTFLDNLDRQLLPRAKQELVRLDALKANDLGVPSATLQAWDFRYYDSMLRKNEYSVDENLVRQYFPVQHTIDAVLSIYQTVLGVTFAPVVPANAWAPEVLRYSVTDSASRRYLGDFYLDLYPRPGKYSHFANWSLIPNRVLPGGGRRAKLAVIVGNWPQPAPGKPALLSHQDVVVFFHEFGHNMAGILGAAPYASLSGYKRDFVEAPSQMLENWVWDPAMLKKLSSRVDTGAPLPDDLIAKIVAAKNVDQAILTTRQVALAVLDMNLHMSGPNVDPVATWRTTVAKYAALPYAFEGSKFPATFGHLFGYDAGYYGYEWSLVYASDMFTAFKAGGLESPVVGMRYRKEILEPAGVYDADTEVRRFLGRDMSADAYYRELGITATAARQ